MSGEGKSSEPSLQPAVFFDLDGTWFRWQLFDEWIREMIRLGLFPEIVYAMAKKERLAYQNREAPFGDWVKKQVEAYSGYMRGIKVADVKFAAHQMIAEKAKRVHVFTRELASAAKDCGYRRVIISGSPQAVVEAFAEANGINVFLGTEHEERGGVYTGVTTKEWVNDKAEGVRYIAGRYGINLDRSIVIGDGRTDARMGELVGRMICFNPEKPLRDLALENGWLVAVEKKDCLHLYRRQGDVTRLVHLDEYLPEPLANNLMDRLTAKS